MLTLDLNFLTSKLLNNPANAATIWVAYSGGIDSEVLLHLVASMFQDIQSELPNVKLKAIHVNHGVSKNADDWVAHCQESCLALSVPLVVETVSIPATSSFENAAREVRYAAFEKHMQNGDLLLQAHHANDQVETMLFRLERGAGLKGVAGIPSVRSLAGGSIWRPLLTSTRKQIEDYAANFKLTWVEDESNTDESYRRNFLRHSVVTPWEANYPEIAKRIASSVNRIQHELNVVTRLADQALSSMLYLDGSLELSKLPLGEERYWISAYLQKSDISLTWPQAEALTKMLMSESDKQPEYLGLDYRLGRWKGRLYLLPLDKPPIYGELEPNKWFECAFGKIKSNYKLELRPRPTGIHLQLKNGSHRPLKKWLHDNNIPTWWRDHLPYLFLDDKLVAIGDLWCDSAWTGYIEWDKDQLLVFK